MHQRVLKTIRAIAIAAVLTVGSTSAFAQKAPAEPRPATRPVAASTKVPAKQTSATPASTTQPAVSTGNAYKALPAIPSTLADLKAIEGRVEEITKKVMPAVVGVIAGRGQGSGVIISADGYVLTAAHVAGEGGRDLTLILADGRRVRAKSLGLNEKMDSGLIKISDKGDWPHVDLSKSSALVKGQWVIALGHPGGYRRDRPPVLRLGRILFAGDSSRFINTDCTLMGGDSGGPLFDLSGNVVGIHSRIGLSTLANMHVPSDTYIETWDRLAKGETWGAKFNYATATGPYLGIGGDPDRVGDGGALIESVASDGPAAKAGVKPGDIVIAFEGDKVNSYGELALAISRKKNGDEVTIQVLREGRKVELSTTLARRP